jgi:hypothetical protein
MADLKGKGISKEITTENLRKKFKNNFELAHFAIRMGRFCIRGGDSSLENILEEVRRNPNEEYLNALEQIEEEGSE